MGKTLLIHSLGNRDLQMAKSAPVPGDITDRFFDNNMEPGGEGYYVVKKQNFRMHCMDLEQSLSYEFSESEYLRQYLELPILQPVMRWVAQTQGGIDRLVLLATKQAQPFQLDTDAAGKIASQLLQQRYSRPAGTEPLLNEVALEFIDSEPGPQRKGRMMKTCFELLQDLQKEGFDQIFISPMAGLPDLSEALIFIGYFQAYTYLYHTPKDGRIHQMDFSIQEDILAQIVKDRVIQVVQQANFRAV